MTRAMSKKRTPKPKVADPNPFGVEGWEEALANAKPDPAADAKFEAELKAEDTAHRAAIKEVASRSWPVPAPPHPYRSAKKPLTVLECGVEGGGVSVVAMFKPATGWRFITSKSEGFGDDDWPMSSWESDSLGSLQEALRLIDVYDWWHFHALIVADAFREEIIASVEARTRANPSPTLLARWRNVPSAPVPRRAASNPGRT